MKTQLQCIIHIYNKTHQTLNIGPYHTDGVLHRNFKILYPNECGTMIVMSNHGSLYMEASFIFSSIHSPTPSPLPSRLSALTTASLATIQTFKNEHNSYFYGVRTTSNLKGSVKIIARTGNVVYTFSEENFRSF